MSYGSKWMKDLPPWFNDLVSEIRQPKVWPYEHCNLCGAPLKDLNASVRHAQGHYPFLWPALQGTGKPPKVK